MKFCIKIFICFWLLASCSWLLPSQLFAKGEIASSQQVYYQVLENGETKVRHEIKLTNLTTNYYASEYSLYLGYSDIKTIAAFDSQGPIATDVIPKDPGTTIHLAFNDQIVGKGKVLAFTITYDTSEIASNNGKIWEVNIPKIRNDEDTSDYATTLSVPASFGKPSYTKPVIEGAFTSPLTFSKEEVLKGISVVFGDYQIFDYTLFYHLRNNRLYPVITEIALPPSSAYQEVLLNTLVPVPLTVYQDKDGNWLARYRLEASERLDIKAMGRVRISHKPEFPSYQQNQNLDEYLAPAKYWETLDPKILEKAKELATPRAIYDYVVDTLGYDFARIEKNLPRAGATSVLNNPSSAICMEFTDLFIALARASGIPAREINGFAYTPNTKLRPLSFVGSGKSVDSKKAGLKDILHAWPEYYDREKKLWIGVDPTWGSTSGIDYFDSFDFNHFAFVIKGHDSEYPSPAGSYKESSDIDKKDVDVTVSPESTFLIKEGIELTSDIPDKILAGFPTTAKILVANQGNTILASSDLLFTADRLLPAGTKLTIEPIPPFGSVSTRTIMKSLSYFDAFTTVAKATLKNKEFTFRLQIMPVYLVYLPWIGGGISAIIICFFALKTWNIHIQRPVGKDPLRGESKQLTQPRFKLPWQKN